MTAKRLFFLLLISLVVLLAGMVGTTYLISGLIKTKAAQLATSRDQVAQLNTSESSIAKTKRDIATYSSLEKITSSIVPQDKDQAATVREIINIGKASKVPITTISFPSSTLGSKPATGGASAPAAAASSATKPNLSQLTPVKNIPGVYELQLTLSNNANNPVSFAQLNNFLKGLENNRRTAAVSTISINPQTNDPNQLLFMIVMNVYIKP